MSAKGEILLVRSYPLQAIGVVEFIRDLISFFKSRFGFSDSFSVCALEHMPGKRDYGKEVKYVLDPSDYVDDLNVARKINQDEDVKAVVVHHEFGLFSGQYGENLLYFLYELNKPVIINFQTVLPNPDHSRKYIVGTMATVSAWILVKTELAKKILMEDYDIDQEKIFVRSPGTTLLKSNEGDIIQNPAKSFLFQRQSIDFMFSHQTPVPETFL